MDKGFLLFIVIGIGAIYLVINSIGDIQAEDERVQNDDYREEHRFDSYDSKDIIGQNILDLSEASPQVQVQAWNNSTIKDEYLRLFPNFSEMKKFIDDRIRGDALRAKLLNAINSTEDKFFSGEISMEKAKRGLRNLR